jgi:hypothetical protein
LQWVNVEVGVSNRQPDKRKPSISSANQVAIKELLEKSMDLTEVERAGLKEAGRN